MAGVKYIAKRETSGITLGGVSIQPNEDGKPEIASVVKMNAFGKKMGYKKGDVFVSINNVEVMAANFQEEAGKFTSTAKEGDMLTVKVKRKNAEGKEEEITMSAPAEKVNKTEEHVLALDDAATAEQIKILNAWLNTTCTK
jgi:RPA family protein